MSQCSGSGMKMAEHILIDLRQWQEGSPPVAMGMTNQCPLPSAVHPGDTDDISVPKILN